MSEIPDEAVEAATKAAVGYYEALAVMGDLGDMARLALTAAYPSIVAQVRRDTAEKIAAEIEAVPADLPDLITAAETQQWVVIAVRSAYTNAARIARGVAAGGQDAAT